MVQQALDVVRVTGNNAIHPGEIDMTDDRDRAATMFAVLNAITEDLVAKPKQMQSLYDGLPESVKQHISQRDGSS